MRTLGSTISRLLAACLTILAFAASGVGSAHGADYDWMFETGEITEIDLGIPPASREALANDPDEYVDGTFAITGTGGQNFGPVPVEVRLKGSSSFRTLEGKAAFKLKFAKPVRPWGLKKMTLNNMVQDPSKVHEALAYEVFRAMGVPASRTGYANVSVNGEPFGLYLNLETLDDQSMERWFSSTGHLYEGEAGADLTPDRIRYFEVDEGDEEDTSDLDDLVEVAGSDPSVWLAAVEPHADLDQMTRMWAVETMLGQYDGYLYNTNNFYLHSDEDGRFSMLPSGLDQTFRWNFEFFLEDQLAHPRSILFRQCLAVADCRSRYADALVDAAAVIRELQIAGMAEDLYETVRPSLEADPRKEQPLSESDDAIAPIGTFIQLQDLILEQLLVEVPEPPTGVEAVPGPGTIDLTWEAARTRGAKPVTGYSIRYRKAGEENASIRLVSDPGAGSVRIAGLKGGTGYQVSVRALSESGPGGMAEIPGSVTPGKVEVAPPDRLSGPAGVVAVTTASFSFAGEPESSFECRADGSRWQPCSSPHRIESLGQGAHRFSVRQLDPAGNTSAPVDRDWSVDTVHPRLRVARYLARSEAWHRLWIGTMLENPALRVRLSTSVGKPAPRAQGKATLTLRQNRVSLRHRARFRWARIEDPAGNSSAWKRIRPLANS